MFFPERIQKIVEGKNFTINEIGLSNSQVLCFDDMVLKIGDQGQESSNEYAMMKWLQNKLPIPKILCYDKSQNINYLLMSRINGNMLCSDYFLSRPSELIKMVAQGLNCFWNVDISDCPCNNFLENKLKLAETRVKLGLCLMEDSEPDTYGENGFESPEALLEWLKSNRPIESPVFSHGDFCLPNIFALNGKISGFIDLGRSGIADKYQDIALCYRSLKHNFSGRYSGIKFDGFDPEIFFGELQIEPDWDLIRYYILLDELF